MSPHPTDRRSFLAITGAAAGGFILTPASLAQPKPESAPPTTDERKQPDGEEDVSPAEDLMREHGVLKRVILVYREYLRRFETPGKLDAPPEPLADAAKIIRNFIEDYHEKLEEDHLFPCFRKANLLVDLVDTLTAQHQAGRRVTDTTMHLATLAAFRDDADRPKLADSLRAFIRMYEPHEAREDTILFPALHKIITPHEYDALGEDFEKKEHQLFGDDGFEKMVDKVEQIEKTLGIYDLAQFTPKG